MDMNKLYKKAYIVLFNSITDALAAPEMAEHILKNAQQHLGFELLHSTTGGKHGGGATLTPEAAALLAAYEEYCSELNTYAKTLFTEKFEQIL